MQNFRKIAKLSCPEICEPQNREINVSRKFHVIRYFFGYLRASRCRLKFARHSSNVVFEEFVLTSLIASPLIKPLFTPGGWHEVKWVY